MELETSLGITKNDKIVLLYKNLILAKGDKINYEHKLCENIKLDIVRDKFKIEGDCHFTAYFELFGREESVLKLKIVT